MNHDLGIRAAVRAAVERESDIWTIGLDGWDSGKLRGTPYGASLLNMERRPDRRDASAMAWWSQSPRYAPRCFLREVTP